MKNKIQNDFIKAMKEKNEIAKTALSSIKAKITEGEKANNNKELSNNEIIKIINKAIKQREESAEIYKNAGRIEQSESELNEANILKVYMPKSLSKEELSIILSDILIKYNNLPNNAKIGKTIGEFNRQYQGQADINIVKEIISNLIK